MARILRGSSSNKQRVIDRHSRPTRNKRRFRTKLCLSTVLAFCIFLLAWAVSKLELVRVSSSHRLFDHQASARRSEETEQESPPNVFFVKSDDTTSNNELPSRTLPAWIRSYLRWHQEMRAQFPGRALWEDPNAPKWLVRTCADVICGGLNDRLGQLPWDLYLANQTNRLLLFHWHMPVHLEEFLLPNELDWRVPRYMDGFFSQKEHVPLTWDDQKKVIKGVPDLFRDYKSGRPAADFFETQIDHALTRAVSGEFKDAKMLRYRMLGHLNEENLERRLQQLGETDLLHYTKSFGRIFKMFFRPSPGLQAELRDVYQNQLRLVPGSYSAVHCRVRHPKATSKKINVIGKDGETIADISGLPWVGEMREFAVRTAIRALRCAQTLLLSKNDMAEPIYFFSDSNDLVRYMAHELSDPAFLNANATLLQSNPVDAAALQLVQSSRVLARDATTPNIHIDRLKGFAPADYYSTFVDVILAANARCLTYGIGNYAAFAAKLSGTSCKLLYLEEEWGVPATLGDNKRAHTQQCPIEM